MSSGLRSAPVASGTLGAVPLAHALVYIRNKKSSGVLELRASTERHAWVVFWRGLILSSMTAPTVARFGTVVYELGLIDAETLDATSLDSANEKRPQMDILLERGAITTAQRDVVLMEQVRRRVHHLFTLPPSTTFTFREGRPSSSEPVVLVDPLAPVWRGLCDFPPDARAAEIVARIGPLALRLVSEAALERAELTPKESALCEALAAAPMTLAQLLRTSDLPASRVELLAYFLVITRCVEIEGAPQAAMPSSALWTATRSVSGEGMSPVPTGSDPMLPRVSSSRLGAAAQPLPARGPGDLGIDEVRRRAAGITEESPFAALGLAEGASAEAARAAYFRLAKLWNPDRLPPALEAVRSEVARVFAHMTQAHTRLTDPTARPVGVSRSKG